MHIPTIYNPKISDKDTIFALDTEKHHHLKNVLRIKDDTKVKISNGKGKIYTGSLSNKNISVESNEIFLRTWKLPNHLCISLIWITGFVELFLFVLCI